MQRIETPLIANANSPPSYGTSENNDEEKAWSFQAKRESSISREWRRLFESQKSESSSCDKTQKYSAATKSKDESKKKGFDHYIYCIIYAIVNVIISAPGLYGYAAVIFNHPVFDNHMNALSKLVIFSSLVHQLGFFLFSTLDFAIGTVQDAGLIFLSAMANTIANRMINDGHSEDEILSTTLVLLSLGTATLGLLLVVMGKFRLADAVAYLPMPVVVRRY